MGHARPKILLNLPVTDLHRIVTAALRIAALIALLFAGCCDIAFEPYNYNTSEEAKLKRGHYSVRVKSKQLIIEKKIRFKK